LLSLLLEFAPELTVRLLKGAEEESKIQVMIEEEFIETWSCPQVWTAPIYGPLAHENFSKDWIVASGGMECFTYSSLGPASGSQGLRQFHARL
jgi:hypothetical protein